MKKLFALAISLIMLLGELSAFPVFATEPAGETQTSYTDVVTMTALYNGNKTVVSGTVYSVSSAEELLMFNEICNTNNQTFDGATVIITKDIDLNEGWTASATAPTNVWGAIKIFKGVLDCGYYTEALQIAENLVTNLARDIRENGLLHEYYNPETKEPICNPGFVNWNVLAINMADELEGKPSAARFLD